MRYFLRFNTANIGRTIVSIALLAMIAHMLMILFASPSFAQAPPLTPRGTCSNDPDFAIDLGGGTGIVTGIISTMQSVLNAVVAAMYNAIISNSNYYTAVKAAIVLYIAVTGVLFTIGATRITVSDLIVRCTKVIVVGIVVSPSSWIFFNGYVIKFFNQGTNEIISVVTQIAIGGTWLGGYPFAPLDMAIAKILSAKMLVTLLALVSPIPPFAPAGPNGLLVGLLIVGGLSSFMRATINAIWVYLMAMVLKAFMFAIAPLFIPFILFNRTRHLFDGWFNQVVNACLQPIMLFAFFSFFIILVVSCINVLLTTPVCWTGWNESIRGSTMQQFWWRFAAPDPDTGVYMPYGGAIDFTGRQNVPGAFPINILMVLTFLMLSELALRFNAVTIEIAKDISGAATNLSGASGSISEWFVKASGDGRPQDIGGGRPPAPQAPQNNPAGSGGGLFGPGGLLGGSTPTPGPSAYTTPGSTGVGAGSAGGLAGPAAAAAAGRPSGVGVAPLSSSGLGADIRARTARLVTGRGTP